MLLSMSLAYAKFTLYATEYVPCARSLASLLVVTTVRHTCMRFLPDFDTDLMQNAVTAVQ